MKPGLVAGVLDVVADCAGPGRRHRLEVGGVGVRARVEHRHPGGTLHVVLPLVRVRVPVQFPHAARLDHDQGGRHRLGRREVRCCPRCGCCRRCSHRPASTPTYGRSPAPAAPFDACRHLVRLEIAWFVTGEDPEVVQGNVVEGLLGDPEVLRQHVGRRVREPVRQQQRVALGLVAAVEREDEFRAVRLSPCRECGSPAGKNQRSSLKTSSTLGFPSRLRVVIRHLPSVMIAHSAVWCQCSSRMPPGRRDVHAGDLVGEREIVLGEFARPAAAPLAPGRDVERGQKRLRADVRPGRAPSGWGTGPLLLFFAAPPSPRSAGSRRRSPCLPGPDPDSQGWGSRDGYGFSFEPTTLFSLIL